MKTIEYGIFDLGGLLEGNFFSKHEASKRISKAYNSARDVYVEEICPRHRCYKLINCEKCSES